MSISGINPWALAAYNASRSVRQELDAYYLQRQQQQQAQIRTQSVQPGYEMHPGMLMQMMVQMLLQMMSGFITRLAQRSGANTQNNDRYGQPSGEGETDEETPEEEGQTLDITA